MPRDFSLSKNALNQAVKPSLELDKRKVSFAVHKTEQIEGMLNKSAIICTLALCKIIENEIGWENSAFIEIGVYKGKFLLIPEVATREFDVRLIGIDPFNLEGQGLDEVKVHLGKCGCAVERLILYKGLSNDTANIASLVQHRPLLFSHIDGDHRYEAVLEDIRFIEAHLDRRGCVLLDDFWNVSHLGVISAVSEYLRNPRSKLRPVAMMNKKLLMANIEMVSFYQRALTQCAEANSSFEVFGKFLQNSKHELELTLFGSYILIF